MVWSGLGIASGQPYGSWFEFNSTTHADIAAPFLPKITQFSRIRIIVERSSATSSTANRLWALDIKGYKPSTYIHFGIANSSSVYLPTFYDTYLPIMLGEAQWAQDNGMDEFQVANEFETSSQLGSLSITGTTRSSNVATATTASAHGLITGDTIVTSGASDSTYNVSQVSCTVTGLTTFTYASTGADGSASGTLLLKPGDVTIIRFVKLLAAAAQAVFTRGPITYSVSQGFETYWTSITPGVDLDLIGLDLYGDSGYTNFVALATAMFSIFGTQMIISEFNINSAWSSSKVGAFGVTNRGFDQRYADELYRRMNFLRNLGVEQAYFFSAWNASSSENNAFTIWYNTNPITGNGGALIGNWKSGYDRLLEKRISKVFLGTQEHT